MYFAEEMLKTRDESVYGKTCLVSGSGNVAQFAVENINRLGGKAVTLSDSSGFIYDPDGIDTEKLEWVKESEERAPRAGSPSTPTTSVSQYHSGMRPWAVEGAEVALPCATQNELER